MRFWIRVNEISIPTAMAIGGNAPERSLRMLIPVSPSNTMLPNPELPMTANFTPAKVARHGEPVNAGRLP
jgi:hypothetical protein